jgi:large subunit ribosomal protein L29
MRASEIRALSDNEILDAVEDAKEEMWILRRDAVTGELKDMNTFRRTKRKLARLKTVLRERELAAQMASEETNDGK